MEPQVAKGMVKGQADRLDSAFHLGYNMIVNLMRVEGISPEFMLENSFSNFKTASVPVMEDKMLTYKKNWKIFILMMKVSLKNIMNYNNNWINIIQMFKSYYSSRK